MVKEHYNQDGVQVLQHKPFERYIVVSHDCVVLRTTDKETALGFAKAISFESGNTDSLNFDYIKNS